MTTTAWRLTPSPFARALDGEGASLAGGRWNSRGVPVLYTSSHLSLCVLEVLVNIPARLRDDLEAFEAVHLDIPDDAGMSQIAIGEFEAMLATPDPQEACRAAGDRWISHGRDLVLAAPSVIIPEEQNLMLNPAHPRMREVAIVSTRRFRFDTRLFAASDGY
jgi:RES domain-containing protein